MNKLAQRIGIWVILLGLAVWFIVMGWWIALIVECVVTIALFVGIAFFMVSFTLKRKAPVSMGTVIGLEEDNKELNSYVRDAVEWLEQGELWEQTSEDGLKLRGRFIKKEGSHTYAICCHGYTNHRLQDISNQAKRFYEMGHNIFAGHARGHGRSEGGYVGMACMERRDVSGWIDMIVEMDPEARIFLYGVSMGGATVMTTSGELLPDNVKCAIEDCGYSSIWNEFKHQLGDSFGVPVFPTLYICELITKVKYGFGYHDHSALEQVKKASIPILFIHGDKDTFVPYAMMQPLYEACGSKYKKALTIQNAEHAESYQVDPDLYWKEVGEWLEKWL